MGPKKREPTDDRLGVTRTYFTEFDPLVQQRYGLGDHQSLLETKLKLSSMFNDTITVAASHLLESDVAFEVMTNNPGLLENAVVVPAINADFEDFKDFVEKKIRDPDKYGDIRTTNAESVDELLERANQLDEITETLITFELGNMSGSFEQGLLSELSDESSPLYARIASETNPREIRKFVKDQNVVTRDDILELEGQLPDAVNKALFDYMQVNYHLTGGAHHHAGLNLPPQELNVVSEKFQRAISTEADADRESVERPYHDGLQNLVEVLTLDYDSMTILNSWELVELHESMLGRRFRRNVEDVIMDVDTYAANKPSHTGLNETASELEAELSNRIASERSDRSRSSWQMQANLRSSNVRQLVFSDLHDNGQFEVEDPVIETLIQNTSDFVGAEFSVTDEARIESTD